MKRTAAPAFLSQLHGAFKSITHHLPHITSQLTIITGLLILTGGWLLDYAPLRNIQSGLATMKVNTALCFILTGVSLFLLIRPFQQGHNRYPARLYLLRLLALVVLVIASSALLQDLLKVDWGIDQWLVRDNSADPHAPPGRMAMATAFGFSLCAISILSMSLRYRQSWYVAQLIAATITMLGLQALIGYFYDPNVLYRLKLYASVSIPTAALFVISATGLFSLPWLRSHSAETDHQETGSWVIYGSAFLLCLLITFGAWLITYHQVISQARSEFDTYTSDITKAIHQRMHIYEQALRGGLGLFEVSRQVSRRGWKTYIDNLQLEENYPGFQGLGYSVLVRPDDLIEHNRLIQAEGFQDYQLWPVEAMRPVYSAIIYLEPFDTRNQRAFGYDMMSEPIRRAAMVKARDTGLMTISGKVTLVQETVNNIQAGFLMYLPHYRNGAPLLTEADRRTALVGYVYAAFRMNNLMEGLLGRQSGNIAIEIYDGGTITDETLLYHSLFNQQAADDVGRFSSTLPLELYGQQWTLRLSSRAGFENLIKLEEPFLVLSAGIFISILFGVFLYTLMNRQRQALTLAGEMNQAYRREQNFTRTLLENMSDAVVACDAEGQLTLMNRTARARRGHDADHQPIQQWANTYHLYDPDTGQPFATGKLPLIRALRGERVINLELMSWKSGQQKRYLSINGGPLIDDNGQLLGAVVVSRDVSERHRMEQQLRQINERLEHSNQELESFTYSVSHDLRSPLRAIEGFAQVLQEDYAEQFDEEGRRLLQIVRDNSQRMSELISDLLAFSRLGQAAITRQAFNMNELIKVVCDEIDSLHADSGVELILNPVPDTCADYNLLRQVWVNLLANAAKFSADKTPPRIEVGFHRNDAKEIVYYVRDNGVGFDMRYYEKLFGVFQRLHKHEEFPGTGVGLAIVQRIINRHGGRVWAESRPNESTVFYFSLPVSEL